ncbi:MAG TPA: type II secretion system protein GspC [bacterium]|nr:type II secretion system protein GspC [bacterium]
MYSLRRYDWTLQLAALIVCAYFLARAITTYWGGVLESASVAVTEVPVAPSAPAETGEGGEASLDLYKVIEERNIFNSAEVAAPETGPSDLSSQQLGEMGPAVKTSLDIKVQSTLVIGDGTDRRSSAMISGGKTKGSKAFFVTDEETFAPNVKLTKVDKDRIEFVNNGRLEYAELEDWASKKSVFLPPEEVHGRDAKGAADRGKTAEDTGASAGKIVLDQKEVDDALQNLDKLQQEVRIVPNFQDGKPAGMKVLSIKPGGLVSKLGIRRGDVLEKVNGQELDIRRGMELFSNMKDSKNFSLDVTRGGKNQTLEYEIK